MIMLTLLTLFHKVTMYTLKNLHQVHFYGHNHKTQHLNQKTTRSILEDGPLLSVSSDRVRPTKNLRTQFFQSNFYVRTKRTKRLN